MKNNLKLKNSSKTNRHLRFAVLAADTVLFTLRNKQLSVRLIPVNRPPYFLNKIGLPGGLLDPKETAETAALRHLKNKALIEPGSVHIEQLYTFSAVNRDPRGRVVAVAYLALAPWEELSSKEQADGKDARWSSIRDLPKLAYDHNEIIDLALRRLRARIGYTTVIAKLLPKEFTLTELEQAYEVILGRKIDRRNFRKKIRKLKLVMSLGRKRRGLKWRPAMLYSFRSKKVAFIDIL